MKLPLVYITEKRDNFETRLTRLVREFVPELTIKTFEDISALRYEIRQLDVLIAEIDTLPKSDNLEIQIAQIEDEVGFCEKLLSMLERVYAIKIPNGWISLLVTRDLVDSFSDDHYEDPEMELLRQKISSVGEERLQSIKQNGATQKDLQGKSLEDKKQDIKPWEKIPENNWDREAIKMWCEGNTNKEIGSRVSVNRRSVTNRICILRKQYPEAQIPTDKERRRLRFGKIHDIK